MSSNLRLARNGLEQARCIDELSQRRLDAQLYSRRDIHSRRSLRFNWQPTSFPTCTECRITSSNFSSLAAPGIEHGRRNGEISQLVPHDELHGLGVDWRRSKCTWQPISFHSRKGYRSRADFNSATNRSSSSADMAEMPLQEKLVLIPIANGSEEMEVVILADILRRVGADVTLASVEDDIQVVCSRNVKLVADTLISACEGRHYDLIVLPGGMPGAEHLRDSVALKTLTQEQAQEHRLYAAICAAPAVAFESWGLLSGLKATCYPSFADKMSNSIKSEANVVRDGNLTTSRGPGTAFEFALSLVEQLYGKEKKEEVSQPLVLAEGSASEHSLQEYGPQDWTATSFEVLVPIANGSEEMEVVIIVDILRRAGFSVTVASVEIDLQILASRNVRITADRSLSDVVDVNFDMIILPGGMPGAERLLHSQTLMKLLSRQVEARKYLGAICAAPAVVFETKGFLKGKKATSHPAFAAKLLDQTAVDGRVVIDGSLITSRGPGTAMEFALSIVGKVLGFDKAQSLANTMLLSYQ